MSEPITNVEDAVRELGALPVPVGSEPRTLELVENELTGVNLALYEEELENARLRLAWKSASVWRSELRSSLQFTEASRKRWRAACVEAERERDELKAQVAELLKERHSTNEALDDAVQALRTRAEEGPAPVPLSTDCANCGHTLNWHGGSGCSAGSAPARCGCRSFVAKAAVLVAASESKATKCRCAEPGVDPYECEAEECPHEFSELNPFGGSTLPVEKASAEVSKTCGCGWRTSVWHVDDGSAEEELHRHVVRVHGGVYPRSEAGDVR